MEYAIRLDCPEAVDIILTAKNIYSVNVRNVNTLYNLILTAGKYGSPNTLLHLLEKFNKLKRACDKRQGRKHGDYISLSKTRILFYCLNNKMVPYLDDIIKQLFPNSKESIFKLTYRGYTPLAYAIKTGHPKLIKWILSKGSETYEGQSGINALATAVAKYRPDLVAFLLKAGVSPYEKDVKGFSAIDHANELFDSPGTKTKEIHRLLLNHYEGNMAQDKQSLSPKQFVNADDDPDQGPSNPNQSNQDDYMTLLRKTIYEAINLYPKYTKNSPRLFHRESTGRKRARILSERIHRSRSFKEIKQVLADHLGRNETPSCLLLETSWRKFI